MNKKDWDNQILKVLVKWCFFYPLGAAVTVAALLTLAGGHFDGWALVGAIFIGYYALLVLGTVGNLNAVGKTYTILEQQEPKILNKVVLYYCLIMGTYLCLLPFMISIWFLGFLIINPGTILLSITIATLIEPKKKNGR